MPSDSPSPGGRRHHFRGRRGHERRSGDRRAHQQPPAGVPEPGGRGDHVDVEQIMREIRSKIAQRHGIELTDQQVQDLAARRLESILDPRSISPPLLDQLRRSAGARPDSVAAADRATTPYEFEDTTLYDSPSGLTRFLRKLLNPILKLFFNPNPLIRALHIQSRLNVEAAKREAERDQRQAEWNALHYEILQRIVGETARVSLEVQSLALQVESLSAKVDFNERRVRGIEGVVHQPRAGAGRDRERERERETAAPPPPMVAVAAAEPAGAPTPAPGGSPDATAGEPPRRRRRRRRGRRGSGVEAFAAMPADTAGPQEAIGPDEGDEGAAEGDEAAETAIADIGSSETSAVDAGTDALAAIGSGSGGTGPSGIGAGETAFHPDTADADTPRPGAAGPELGDTVTTGTETIDQLDEAGMPSPAEGEPAPERVTPQLAFGEPAAREEAAPEIPAPVSPDDKTQS